MEPVQLHKQFLPPTPVVPPSPALSTSGQAARKRQEKLAEALASEDEKEESKKAVHKVGQLAMTQV